MTEKANNKLSFLAITLVIISAFMHAGWNLLSKSQRPQAAFFLLATFTGSLLLSPLLIYHWRTLSLIPDRVWILLVLTGVFQGLYFISLAGAYRAGNISVAYPLARSSPVIVVTIVTLFLGRGEQVSSQCIVGILLVVGGCFLIPLKRFNDLSLNNYLNATCGLALLAAFGTAGYSMLDDEALRILRTNPEINLGTTLTTLIYACLLSAFTFVWLAIFVAGNRKERTQFPRIIRSGKRHAATAGVAIQLTYAIVLISLAFVDNVSYVVGFRQLSIPLGATLGIIILKEKAYSPKITGVIIMFIGLVLIAAG